MHYAVQHALEQCNMLCIPYHSCPDARRGVTVEVQAKGQAPLSFPYSGAAHLEGLVR